MGSNPGEVDFFSIHIDTFWGSNPGEVNFFPSSFFFLFSRECNSIEGCCLCCSINFICGMFFLCKLACMAVNNIQATVMQYI